MDDHEDELRHYLPLMRRFAMLVGVVVAIPVVLWTIMAFVHSPVFKQLAAHASTNTGVPSITTASDTGGSAQPADAPSTASAPIDVKPATPDVAPAAKGSALTGSMIAAPVLSDRTQAGNGGSMTSAPPAVMAAIAPPADNSAAPLTPPAPAPMPAASDPANTGAIAMQAPGLKDSIDSVGPTEPLQGAVPLPRHRPHDLTMAQVNVPVPRPRPTSAETASNDTSGPIDWLNNIFTNNSGNRQ